MYREIKPSTEVLKAVQSARLTMMMDKRTTFFSVLLSNLKLIFTDQAPTAAVDGLRMYMNPAFVDKINLAELVGLNFHEIAHIVLDHLNRRSWLEIPKENWPVYMEACEHAANLLVTGSGFVIPPGGVLDKKFAGMSTMQIYEHLLANPQDRQMDDDDKGDILVVGVNMDPGEGDGQPGEDGKDPLQAAGDMEEQVRRHEEDMTDLLLRAVQQAEMMQPGCVPAGVERRLQEILNPKLPWYLILENHVEPYARDDYSRRRPNKRYLPDFYLPSLRSEEFQSLFAAVDVSGSMDDETLTKVTSELRHIHNMLKPVSTRVISVDTQIHDDLTYAQGEYIDDLVLHGGGGTEIEPVIQKIREEQPKLALLFTDGYFYMPDLSGLSTDLIWVIINNPNFTVDTGTVIHYDG